MEKDEKPVTQVLVKHKETQSLLEFAAMLESIAKKLKEDQKFIITQGKEVVEIKPSNQLEVEIEYEIKRDKHSFEIEIDWYPDRDYPTMEIL
ncbi:amphi-Trp domain-containing protein [Bacillus andreraoultii]|uniref:amphi-Trp domain-containing protein n=1 Tax=Bacillus andreraoultii TaxID=1499685 RepID=UPI00053AAB96|nr:amphi-Trp domain-containing protein [Bacillus andreraoultii]